MFNQFTPTPQVDKKTLEGWVRRGLGSPEQIVRYRDQLDMYDHYGVDTPDALREAIERESERQEAQPQHTPALQQIAIDFAIPASSIEGCRGREQGQPEKILIVTFTGLALAPIRGKHPGGFLAWTFANNLDARGGGVVTRDSLRDYLRRCGAGGRQVRRWLSDALRAGFFSSTRQGRVLRIASRERVARGLGVTRLGAKVRMPAEYLTGDHWRSWIWAAYLQSLMRDKTCEKTGPDGRPVPHVYQVGAIISREKLRELTGVPGGTQRYLEKFIPVEYKQNYSFGEDLGDRLERSDNAFIRHCKGGLQVIASRKPDARKVKLDTGIAIIRRNCDPAPPRNTGKGRNNSTPAGGFGAYCSKAGGTVRAPGRLFYDDQGKLDKKAKWVGTQDRQDITELFLKNSQGRVTWWQSVSLQAA